MPPRFFSERALYETKKTATLATMHNNVPMHPQKVNIIYNQTKTENLTLLSLQFLVFFSNPQLWQENSIFDYLNMHPQIYMFECIIFSLDTVVVYMSWIFIIQYFLKVNCPGFFPTWYISEYFKTLYDNL